MSKINDALKRAKNVQQKSPPPAPNPQFRPHETKQEPSRGMGMTVLFVGVLIAFVSVIVLLKTGHTATEIHAATENKPAAPVSVADAKPAVAPASISTPTPTMTTSATEKPTVPIVPPSAASAPAPLKLQAIFYTPPHSSAIISGKTVRSGDMVKGFRVTALTQNSATLVSATQTNVLTLDQ